MKRIRLAALTALAVGVLAVPASGMAVEKGATVDRVVAVVDDQIILLSELAAASAPFEERAAQEAPDAIGRALARKQVREKILNDMIGDKLVEQQAKDLGLSVTDREVDAEVARLKKENNLDDAEFVQQMRAQGMEMGALRELLRKQRLRQKVIEARVQPRVSISDAEVKAYYSENYKNDDQVHVRMLSKRIPQAATEGEVKRLREKLEALRADVTTGGKDFGAVAKKETEGPNAENGGDLGWFKRGEIAAEIEQAAFALRDGEVSPVIEFGGALHILQVIERKAAPAKPLEEVQDKIRGILFNKAGEKEYERWVAELRAKAFIEIRLDGPVPAEEAAPAKPATPAKK
ncbi:MAG TPA: peptidylprolyl isomerase [bacterium]|nr:peptidylprolyl isomerase [bacterium]